MRIAEKSRGMERVPCVTILLFLFISNCYSQYYSYAVYQNGTRQSDVAYGIVVDDNGNQFITGSTDGSLYGVSYGGEDIFVTGFYTDGTTHGVTYGTPENDKATAIIYDKNRGNIIICGSTEGDLFNDNTGDAENGFVMALSASTLSGVWAYQLSNTEAASFRHLALDPTNNNNLYLIGNTKNSYPHYSQNLTGSQDYLIIQMNIGGATPVINWLKLLGTNVYSYGRNIAVDAKGFIYVCGFALGSSVQYRTQNNGESDMLVAKMNSAGSFLWVKLIGGPKVEDSWWIAFNENSYGTMYIAADTNGNFSYNGKPIDVVGDSLDNIGLVAVNMNTGAVVWFVVEGVSNKGAATPAAIYYGSDSNLYLSGMVKGNFQGIPSDDNSEDVLFAIYSNTGTLQYFDILGSSATELVYGMYLDQNLNAYIAGSTDGEFGAKNNGFSSDYYKIVATKDL